MSHRCRVLVVDDDADLRDSVVDAVSALGHDAVWACDGIEAIALLASDPLPDVILLHLMMPRMDGVAFRGAQLAEPRLRGIPVVVLSASEAVGVREQLGVAELHRKPVGLSMLGGILRRQCPPTPTG